MTDKEINKAILEQLYKIALGVWSLTKKNISGSFTAREVCKMLNYYIFWGKNDVKQEHTVKVGTFECSFTTESVFAIVAKFENIAGVGKKRQLFVAEEKGEVEGSITFEVSKDMCSLCDFTDSKSPTSAWQHILIDTERNCLVATEGHRMMVQPINVCYSQGDTTDMYINAKDFGKMCQKMKNGMVYRMTARKEHIYLDHITKVEIEGVLSSVQADFVYPKWTNVYSKQSSQLCLNVRDWQSVCSFAKPTDADMVAMVGKHGDNFLTIEANGSSRTIALTNTIQYDFKVFMVTVAIMASKNNQAMCLYLGTDATSMIQAVGDSGAVYGIMPGYVVNECFIGNRNGEEMEAPHVEMDMDILQMYVPVKKTEATPMQQVENESKKADKKNRPAKTQSDASRKFSFEAVDVKPGDVLTFVDGTEVVAVEGTKVAYLGKEYTLSGFCKQFMPDEKRNKANSYRGCAFFYSDGVKLEKLFKDIFKATEKTEEPTATETTENGNQMAVQPEMTELAVIIAEQENPATEAIATADAAEKKNVSAPMVAIRFGRLAHLLPCVPFYRAHLGIVPLRRHGASTGFVWRCSSTEGNRRSTRQVVHTLSLPPPPAI